MNGPWHSCAACMHRVLGNKACCQLPFLLWAEANLPSSISYVVEKKIELGENKKHLMYHFNDQHNKLVASCFT